MGMKDACCQDCEFKSSDRASLNRHRRRFHSSEDNAPQRTASNSCAYESNSYSTSRSTSPDALSPTVEVSACSSTTRAYTNAVTFNGSVRPSTPDGTVHHSASENFIGPPSPDTITRSPTPDDSSHRDFSPNPMSLRANIETVIGSRTFEPLSLYPNADKDEPHLPGIREVFPAINFDTSIGRFFTG
ncbi:hypothetical protein PM082_020263 [Marasmius tenuissimus]|nr:hypothetical protein PM082_020263 [Marasmius tenuissimus]